MQLQRLFDLSIYYWLKDTVSSEVTVEDGFPTKELVLPTVSITSLDITGKPFELGGCEMDTQFWRVDVFAVNKAQRDALAYIVYKALEQGIPVYNYDEGFPPSISPTQIGTLIVSKRVSKPIHVFPDLVEKLYWRSSVTFFTYYQPI